MPLSSLLNVTWRRDPEINYAVRLAQHFAVSLDWLLGLSEDSGARYSPEIISLANKYIHATKDDKQVIDLILSKYAE